MDLGKAGKISRGEPSPTDLCLCYVKSARSDAAKSERECASDQSA